MRFLRGACLCGACKYTLADRLQYIAFCHCTDCQKQTGATFTLVGGAGIEDFELDTNATAHAFKKGSGNTFIHFCSQCGSQLYAYRNDFQRYHVRLGTLDEMPTLPKIIVHVFVASKHPLTVINDGYPQYAKMPPGF